MRSRREASIRRVAAGDRVAVTEPVPLHLLDACGFVDATPTACSAAVEDGRDVAAAVLEQRLALLNDHHVVLLTVYDQAERPTIDLVAQTARGASRSSGSARRCLRAGTRPICSTKNWPPSSGRSADDGSRGLVPGTPRSPAAPGRSGEG